MTKCLEHGEKAEETSDKSAGSGIAGSSSTSVLSRRGGNSGAGHVAGGGLRLTITDLRDDRPGSRSDGPGSGSLGLAVRDLGDDGSSGPRGCSLRLAIRDLRDNGTAGPRRRSLWLAVANLGDNGTAGPRRGCLGLSVADLRDNGTSRGRLRLAVGDLRNTGRLGDLGLTIWDLRGTTASCNSYDVDRNTLSTNALAVQVVEGAGETLVPYSRRRAASGRESEGAIAAD